ncbi:MAG: tetratricopeptide repeat protein [Aridibacter famidurans]|nr:tetratricopeptide repeat protein [Aridibacter famidurans]
MINPATRTHYYDFGSFRLDVSNRLLLKDGEHVPLTQKSFEILCFLICNRHRMLKKQEILDEVWSESFVEEANLAQHIYMVRKALRNNGSSAEFIETIPKYGYRFTGEVSESYADSPSAAESASKDTRSAEASVSAVPAVAAFRVSEKPSARTHSRLRKYVLLAGPAIAVALISTVLTAAAYLYFTRSTSSDRLSGIRSISVLPFEQIGGEKDEKLGLGLADTLISRLGNQDIVSVSPTSTVARYASNGGSPVEIGRELGVDAVLTGTIQRDGDRIRINVQLISIADRAPVWADRIDGEFSDIFRLQDAVSHDVATKLTAMLSGKPAPAATELEKGDPEAIQAFTKGVYFWNKRAGQNLAEAIGHFNDAVRADPTFAAAHAMLADSYALAAIYEVDSIESVEAIRKGKVHAEKALSIDAKTSEAYSALAVIAQYERDAERALTLLKKAIECDGTNAAARMRLAWMYAVDENLEGAIREMKLAQKADPHSQVINLNLARLLRLNRQTDEALEFGKRAVELDPSMTWTRVILAEIYEQKGMLKESIQELRAVPRSAPEQKTARLLMSRVLAKQGNKNEARKILHDVTKDEAALAPSADVASVYALLGEKKEAFKELQRSEEDSLIHYLQLKYDPNLDPLRDNPEYPGILTQSRKNFIENYDKNS